MCRDEENGTGKVIRKRDDRIHNQTCTQTVEKNATGEPFFFFFFYNTHGNLQGGAIHTHTHTISKLFILLGHGGGLYVGINMYKK